MNGEKYTALKIAKEILDNRIKEINYAEKLVKSLK